MREKWNKKEVYQHVEGQPVGQRIALFSETYRPKLFGKVPSMKAIDTYNSIQTEGFSGYDNLSYTPDSEGEYRPPPTSASLSSYPYDYATTASATSIADNSLYGNSVRGDIIYTNADALYEYPLFSGVPSTGDNRSDAGSRKDDQGSTAPLFSAKMKVSCWSCFTYTETVLCTISLAAGLGNLYRLPQTTLIRGGLPFLVAYLILSLVVGLPMLFLELGLGQLAQEGFTKTWRAVPLFRGVGFVKFTAICLLSLYYPLYMGLFANYLIWLGHGPPPFTECASVKMMEFGYKAEGIPAQECLRKTFLESPFSDPKWYGVYIGLVFLVWVVVIILLIGRTKTYVKSLTFLLIPTVGCMIALIVKAVAMENIFGGLNYFTEADWSILGSANVWYYAVIQVIFSTNIGFGSFVTNAGIMFSKVNAFWTALGYILANMIIGIVSVIVCFSLAGELNPLNKSGEVAELHLIAVIYDSAQKHNRGDAQIWTIVAFAMLLCSGLITTITMMYTLLKAIKVETRQKWAWWQTCIVISFLNFFLGAVLLLPTNFKLIHLLDHYVVGNLILIAIALEVLAFLSIYGLRRIQLDFEFILGKRLQMIWLCSWYLIPLILIGLLVWGLATLDLTGIWIKDPVWLYGVGWAVVLTALIFIFAMGCTQVYKQDEYYTFSDKMVAVTKPLRKWGPVDPIMRYSWVQWHSKAKDGERDFTLKRRGTKDYTHSVKKRKEPRNKVNIATVSNTSTLSRGSPSSYNSNDLNQNSIKAVKTYDDPLRIHVNSPYPNSRTCSGDSIYDKPLRVTSLVDVLDPSESYGTYLNDRNSYPQDNHKNVNPLSLSISTFNEQTEGSTSEGYGTFRKGPYIISDDRVEHVCHKRRDEHEISTEL